MELLEAKITAMIALGFGSLITGLIPTLFTRFTIRASPLCVSTLLCFGAGVLFSTALLHMLPEIREDLGVDYERYAELILCGGFFILYIIEEIVHLFNKEHNHGHVDVEVPTRQPNYGATETEPLISQSQSGGSAEEPSQLCHIGHDEPCQNNTGAFSLLLALTIHAILEGLAVGLESSTEQVLMMLGAVASHKLVVGFCLGAELSSSRHITACQYFTAIVLFSFGSSLGIGIGWKIADLPDAMPKILMPILQGLAGGTLLYVTVIEVLPRERARWHKGPLKLAGILQVLMTAVGFTLMTLLIFYLPS